MADIIKVADTSTVINVLQSNSQIIQIPVTTTQINIVQAGQIIMSGGVDPSISDAATSIDIGAGQPIYVSKVNGQAVLADATSLNSADIAGLAIAAAASGFRVSFTRSKLTLVDWTAALGVASLQSGYDYFLSATPGQITTTPPLIPGQCVVFIGTAISTTSMLFAFEPPILL